MAMSSKLLKLMEDKGINRSELAKGAGIPYTTIVALFEKGTENIKLSTMRKLADYFGVTLDDLAQDNNDYEIQTIAAHHDGETWTEEELETIRQFKEFVKSQRKSKE